ALIRVGEKAYRFLWSHHHLLLDGWSLSLVLKHVFADYEAARHGLTIPPEPIRPYRDYVAWLKPQDLDAAEKYWRNYLEGEGTSTSAGIGRTAPARGELALIERKLELSADLTAALNALARKEHLTLHTIVQSAWGLLLAHCTGRDDVVF